MINSKMVWKLDPEIVAANLTRSLRNKGLRIALNAAAVPAKEAVIKTAPSKDGLLSRATRIKIKNYRKGDAWVAVVGAITSFKRAAKTIGSNGRSQIKRDTDGNKVWIVPGRYQYPLDQGSVKAAPKNYMASAFVISEPQFHQIAGKKLGQFVRENLPK